MEPNQEEVQSFHQRTPGRVSQQSNEPGNINQINFEQEVQDIFDDDDLDEQPNHNPNQEPDQRQQRRRNNNETLFMLPVEYLGTFGKHPISAKFLVANLLYLLTLQKCYDRGDKCYDSFHNIVIFWGVELVACAYIFTQMFIEKLGSATKICATYKEIQIAPTSELKRQLIVQKRDCVVSLLIALDVMFLTSLDQGLRWKNHGTLSRIFMIKLCSYLFSVGIAWKYLNIIKERSRAIWFTILGVCLFLFLHHLSGDLAQTKLDYFKGFAGKKYEHLTCKKCCNFPVPKVNWLGMMDEVFWSESHRNSDCSLTAHSYSIFQKKCSEAQKLDKSNNCQYFAYPRSEDIPDHIRQHYHLFQKEMIQGIQVVKPHELQSMKQTTYLQFKNLQSIPDVKFNIKRNETLIKEKIKIWDQKDDQVKHRPSLLMINLDSMSRQHFFRKMKKTTAFLEKYFEESPEFYLGDITKEDLKKYDLNNKKTDGNLIKAYQFFRYHSISGTTSKNLLALRYDDLDGEYQSIRDQLERTENNYKDEGYITAAASGKCEVDEIDLQDKKKDLKYVDPSPMDYELYGLACDPNSTPKLNPFGGLQGPYSEYRRCLYGKDSSAHLLDFIGEFWKTYHDIPKMANLDLFDGHEFTGELPHYLDGHMQKFLEGILTKQYFNDSIIVFYGDHGNNANLFLKHTVSGHNEVANPFLLFLMTERNSRLYGDMLKKNEQALVSPHDLHKSLNEIVRVYKEYVGRNFMTQDLINDHKITPDQEEEGNICKFNGIPLNFCRCMQRKNRHSSGSSGNSFLKKKKKERSDFIDLGMDEDDEDQ